MAKQSLRFSVMWSLMHSFCEPGEQLQKRMKNIILHQERCFQMQVAGLKSYEFTMEHMQFYSALRDDG